MKICEGCIKQDVCKFKDKVEAWQKEDKEQIASEWLSEPLTCTIECAYKESREPYLKYMITADDNCSASKQD